MYEVCLIIDSDGDCKWNRCRSEPGNIMTVERRPMASYPANRADTIMCKILEMERRKVSVSIFKQVETT